MFCWKCGTETQGDAVFCHKCGAALGPTASAQARTGFELLRDDKSLMDHWAKRGIAYLIDILTITTLAVIVAVVASVPLFIGAAVSPTNPFMFPGWWGFWWGIIPLIVFGYFIIADAAYGRTLGKQIMGLRVQRVDGGPVDLWASLVRNISKINILLLILDVAAGLAMRGEMSQKFSDRYVGTRVEAVTKMTIIS